MKRALELRRWRDLKPPHRPSHVWNVCTLRRSRPSVRGRTCWPRRWRATTGA